MRDASREVIEEAASGPGQFALTDAHEFVTQELGELRLAAACALQAAGFTSGHLASGTCASRLRILCARHRCRSDRGNATSSARIRPGAPSLQTSSRSHKLRFLRSRRKPRQLAVSPFVPGARPSSTL